jgi:phospholipid transport system substrate-binding protein
MIKINVNKFLIIALFLVLPLSSYGKTFEEEEDFVNKFAVEAITILSDETLNENDKNNKFANLVMSSIDINLISKFVLSKSWKTATDEQKEAYINAFKKYFINSYANKLNQYSGEQIIVSGSEEAGKYIIVNSNIVREGTDTLKISLKWRLLNKNGVIKIIDLNIEGISLVIAQREEFQSFLANNDDNLDTLIKKLISVSN